MSVFSRSEPRLRVEMPAPKEDRAITSRVGLIAVTGFVLGIAWPRLFDIHVGPEVPGRGDKQAIPPPSPEAPILEPAGDEPGAAAGPSAAGDEEPGGPSNKQSVVIGDGVVTACRNKKGDKIETCGKLALDKVVSRRLQELARCPAAIGLEGVMSLGIAVNFERSDLLVVEGKKSAALPSSTVKGVLACAAKELTGIELDRVPHTHPRYTVEYELAFYPPGKSPAPAPLPGADPKVEETGLGRATVVWEKALLRETPEDGKIAHRLPQSTEVVVLEEQKGWFLISAGKKKGWVAKGAIGK